MYFFSLPWKQTMLGNLRHTLITEPPKTKIKREGKITENRFEAVQVEVRRRVINLQSSWGSRLAPPPPRASEEALAPAAAPRGPVRGDADPSSARPPVCRPLRLLHRPLPPCSSFCPSLTALSVFALPPFRFCFPLTNCFFSTHQLFFFHSPTVFLHSFRS